IKAMNADPFKLLPPDESRKEELLDVVKEEGKNYPKTLISSVIGRKNDRDIR
ncbi:unnamed protein product, partial [Dovyalis caffra]